MPTSYVSPSDDLHAELVRRAHTRDSAAERTVKAQLNVASEALKVALSLVKRHSVVRLSPHGDNHFQQFHSECPRCSLLQALARLPVSPAVYIENIL